MECDAVTITIANQRRAAAGSVLPVPEAKKLTGLHAIMITSANRAVAGRTSARNNASTYM